MTVLSRRVLAAITILGAVGLMLLVLGTVSMTRGNDASTDALDAPTTSVDLNDVVEPTPGPPPEDDAFAEIAAAPLASIDASDALPPLEVAPIRVRIPTIDVDSGLVDLGLNDDRTLEVPQDFAIAGWYTGRSVPGETGPGVIVGHVDSAKDGPAVFFKLRQLEPGDVVTVERSDGSVAQFQVTHTQLVDKDAFPTDQVYGQTDQPTLRLITCGGGFDQGVRSYEGNIIVFAEHVGTTEAPLPRS